MILSLFFWFVFIPAYSILPVYFPQKVIDTLEAGKSFGEIVKIVAVFSALLLFIPMYEDVFNMCYKNKTLSKITLDIKHDVYLQALKTDCKYMDNPEYYDNYTWAVNEYSEKAGDAHDLILNFSGAVIIISAMLAIIASIGPWVILLTFLNVLMRMYGYHKNDELEVEKDEKIMPYDRRLGYCHRVFYMNNYAADLKSTNLKEYILDNYDKAKKSKLDLIKQFGYKTLKWGLACDVVYRGLMALVTLHIAYEIFNGRITSVGAYMTLMLAVDRLDQYLFQIFDLVRSGSRLSLYAEKIKAFFELKSEIEDEKINKGKLIPLEKAFSVEFKNVSFQYGNSNFAISDLNLKINQGEKIAIVGENGAGKSTLVKLLSRLYDVNSGDILIDNISIKDYDIHSLRHRIGVAFQTPNIYALPFVNNIELYNHINDERRDEIIKKFGLNKVLDKNGADISTELTKEFDEKGIILSGGEIQKIGLARVMTGAFGLLLLDEPSSALDPIAEYEINKLILDSSNQSTTIMVAHRLSTIRDADRIILVDKGTVRETGTHDDLMSVKGKYYEMFTKQAENYVK